MQEQTERERLALEYAALQKQMRDIEAAQRKDGASAVKPSDVSNKNWTDHIKEALVVVNPDAASEAKLSYWLGQAKPKGSHKRVRCLNLRRFIRGDHFCGVAALPHGALEDSPGRPERCQKAVRECLAEIEEISLGAFGRADARKHMEVQLEASEARAAAMEARLVELEKRLEATAPQPSVAGGSEVPDVAADNTQVAPPPAPAAETSESPSLKEAVVKELDAPPPPKPANRASKRAARRGA